MQYPDLNIHLIGMEYVLRETTKAVMFQVKAGILGNIALHHGTLRYFGRRHSHIGTSADDEIYAVP